MRNRIVFYVCFSVILAGAVSFAFPGIENAKRVNLENGLEVMLVENHAVPIVSANLFIRSGSALEPEGMNGASHLLEHLLFNGTERRTQKELYDEADFLGAYNNAFTREDYTCFQMIVPSDLLSSGLDIQSDMLFHSTIPDDKFEKEKGIVLEEIGKELGNPDYRAELFFLERAFSGTPYAQPVLGTVESIQKISRDALFQFYKQQYVPNNMVLFLVGDFDPENAMKMIQKYFGTPEPADFPGKAEPDFALMREKNLFKGKIDGGRNYLQVITQAPDLNSPDFVPFQILVSALSEGDDSILTQALKKQSELPIIMHTLSHGIYGGKGILQFSAVVPPDGSPEKVAERYLEEIRRVAAEGIGKDELERARKALKSSEVYQEEQFHYYPVMKGQWIAFTKPGFLERYIASLERLDIDEVNAVAEKYLKQPHPVVTIAGPQQPDEAVEKFSMPSYEAKKQTSGTEEVRRESLDNGLTVIAKRDDAARIFSVHLLMKNRSINEPDGMTGIADLTHRMLTRGTVTMNASDLSGALKEIGAKVKFVDAAFIPYDDYYTTPLYSFIRFEVLSEDHRRGLTLLKEIVFHPSFPENEIADTIAEMADIIKKGEERVSSRAKNFFFSKIFAGSKIGNSVYGTDATVRSITREDLLAFHKSYFSPQNIIISVVSDIPPEKVIHAVKEIFGNVKASAQQLAAMPEMKPTQKGERFDLEGGREQSSIHIGYLVRVDEQDVPALLVANAILSDRMAFELRERQGMAYSIGSSITRYGDLFLFLASMGTRPENLENAVAGINEEIGNLAGSEISDREMKKTVNSIVGRSVMRRISGINRAYFIGLSEFQGRGVDEDLQLIQSVKNVTVEQVKKAAARYLQTEPAITVIAR